MDYELHVPTEQYGFILGRMTGTHAEAVQAYREIAQEWKKPQSDFPVGPGLKNFNTVLDSYLEKGTLTADEYGEMSLEQQRVIQEIKKSNKRRQK